MEVESWVVWDKVEELNWSKLVPSVNTSYETCMLSNVTAGPLDSSTMADDLVE